MWLGKAFGAKATLTGECVFHTGHQGYQEILTDPSYTRQILIFSAPQIGNQGFCEDDFESDQIWAAGAVVRDYSPSPFQWRQKESLSQTMERFGRPGISGIDTRRLILHLREHGNLWGVLSTETTDPKILKKHLDKKPSMEGLSLTSEVTTRKAYVWQKGSHSLLKESTQRHFMAGGKYKKCVVMDFGVKRQILRYLVDAGFENIVVVPASTTAEEILQHRPDVVMLSNGPGDPAAEAGVIQEVKKLHGKVPLFGICLGHQILALSLGLQTYKLKFGHHAANHPVRNLQKSVVEITSQNHGFAVPYEANHLAIEYTHVNLNDETIEGFRHRKLPIYGIQFHPEAGPGPLDSVDVFQRLQFGALV